jgi:transcription-repair coupling factor (superfamily II helicase)
VQKVRIVKTLSHLNPLFLQSGVTIYSNFFSNQIFQTIQSAEIIDKSNVKFTDIINRINNSNLNNPEVLDEFRVGEALKFNRVENPETNLEFAVKGDIISIWPIGYDYPIRLEFFGEEIEELYIYDFATGKKLRNLNFIILVQNYISTEAEIGEIKIHNFTHESVKTIHKEIFTNRSIDGIEKFYDDSQLELVDTQTEFPQLFFANLNILKNEIERLKSQGFQVLINTNNKEKLENFNKNLIEGAVTSPRLLTKQTVDINELKNLPAGFIDRKNKIAFFTDREIFGSISLKNQRIKNLKDKNFQKLLKEFEGDIELESYVVHEDYGVAIYKGLKQEEAEGSVSEYLLLEFAEKDELFVPISQLSKITRYLGQEGTTPRLTSLGKGNWKKLKAKVKKSTERIAKDLIEHLAKRKISEAEAVNDKDSEEYKSFVRDFKYEETDDQIRSINEVISDLEKSTPMDRLIVGDVGFGKTEVIMRAAFKIIENGGQVAVLAPTTVLAMQHFNTFTERFKKTKFKINVVSRFKTPSQNREIIDAANYGDVDILIGTHRLLSSDLKFDNLQLLVVDEEQKFGVKQKEKIKKLNYGVHVLSVSATPIPRTLSLALSSVQEISIITTPPTGRQSVETEIIFNDWNKAANAIQTEVSRGGQVYFVHNRVNSIDAIEKKLITLIPNISIAVAHGQMNSDKLDKVITDFYNRKFDVLISTNIIENGLDLPNVNTILIHDAHTFGLSQLYQMRGRVGRSERKAYCYIMCPKVTDLETAKDEISDHLKRGTLQSQMLTQSQVQAHIKSVKKKSESTRLYMERLETLVKNQDLGAGFKVASKDLEIRGAGNFLGEKQSGHISQIGYALYIEMLAQEIERLRALN